MNNTAVCSYNTKKMGVEVIANSGSGRTFKFDVSKINDKLSPFGSYFSNKMEVAVDEKGAGSLRVLDGKGEICPTSALKKVVKHLAKQRVETLRYEDPDSVNSLEAHAEIPPGKDIPLSVWKQQLPPSESLLRTVDDGK